MRYFTYLPSLLLRTTGARSGRPHLISLAYLPDGDNYVVIAANAGAPRHPDWYCNLLAHPQARIEVGSDVLDVTAIVATDQQREMLYRRFAAACPQVTLYQASTARQFPLVTLVPADSAG